MHLQCDVAGGIEDEHFCPCLQYLLMPGGPVPGECLALNGSQGYVDIKLRSAIVPTAITYEHVPSSIAYDIRSAPQDITVVRHAYSFCNNEHSLCCSSCVAGECCVSPDRLRHGQLLTPGI